MSLTFGELAHFNGDVVIDDGEVNISHNRLPRQELIIPIMFNVNIMLWNKPYSHRNGLILLMANSECM